MRRRGNSNLVEEKGLTSAETEKLKDKRTTENRTHNIGKASDGDRTKRLWCVDEYIEDSCDHEILSCRSLLRP